MDFRAVECYKEMKVSWESEWISVSVILPFSPIVVWEALKWVSAAGRMPRKLTTLMSSYTPLRLPRCPEDSLLQFCSSVALVTVSYMESQQRTGVIFTPTQDSLYNRHNFNKSFRAEQILPRLKLTLLLKMTIGLGKSWACFRILCL